MPVAFRCFDRQSTNAAPVVLRFHAKNDVYQRHLRSFRQQCIKRTLAFGSSCPVVFSLCINDLTRNLYLVNRNSFSSNSALSSCLPRLSRRRRRASRYKIPAEKSNKRVVHVGRDFNFLILCDSRSSSYSGRNFWSKGFTFECNFYVRPSNFLETTTCQHLHQLSGALFLASPSAGPFCPERVNLTEAACIFYTEGGIND